MTYNLGIIALAGHPSFPSPREWDIARLVWCDTAQRKRGKCCWFGGLFGYRIEGILRLVLVGVSGVVLYSDRLIDVVE